MRISASTVPLLASPSVNIMMRSLSSSDGDLQKEDSIIIGCRQDSMLHCSDVPISIGYFRIGLVLVLQYLICGAEYGVYS